MNIRRANNTDMNGINKLLHQVLMVHHNGRPDLFKSNAKNIQMKRNEACILANSSMNMW